MAVKVLPEPVSGNPDRLKRFEQEAKAAAALNHPGILAVHDIGWHQGAPYIVSELLEGETLRERLRAGALPVKKALEVALPLARALAAAHEKGIVHRDLKPENVFLTRDGQVKVLDFGLAKLLPTPEPGSESALDPTSTASGTVVGTTPYMSPEQLRGQKTDACTDVFSLGVLLYEMLAGRRPFLGESAADVEAAILQQDPPRLLDLDVAVSPLLERIAEKCLEKRPEDRFPSAHDLAIALEAVSGAESAGRAVLSGPMARRFRRLARQRWVPAAALLLLGIGAGWAFWRSRSEAEAGARIGSLAVLPLLNLSGDPEQEYFADGVTEALIANLAKIRAIKVISRTSVMQYKTSKKPLPQIAQELKVDAVVEGSVLRSGDRVRVTAQLIRAATDEHLWAETYERNLTDIQALQNEIARTVAGEVRIQVTPQEQARLTTARSVDPEAYSLYLKGRYHYYTWKPEHLEKAIAAFEQATQRDADFALGYAALAEAHAFMSLNGYVRPQEAYPKARIAVERALALDPNLPEALAVLGAIQFEYDWNFSEGEKTSRRAVELGPSSLPAYFRHSLCLTLLGRFDEAVAEGRRMLELDPVTWSTNYYLAWIYSYAGRFDESIAQFERTSDLDPDNPQTDSWLALTYALAGRYPQALVACDRYRARRALGYDDALDSAVAWSYAVSGRRDEAIKMLEGLQELRLKRYVDPYYMAVIYSGLGDNEQALEWIEKAYGEHSSMLVWLKVEVFFNAEMRRDPRYGEMMRRAGLPAFMTPPQEARPRRSGTRPRDPAQVSGRLRQGGLGPTPVAPQRSIRSLF